ncbi:MAG: dephospho-CoA kinase [Candidatus Aminicenantes bacterium]|nr:dephospho-CoA kinase [Candidatus Aminicenantes bacterium]
MLIVALTGGIATGKSIVAKTLQDLGCYVHHADQIAHQLMEPGKPAWKKIVSRFGEEILKPDKTINRIKLGAIVFSDEKKRNFINQLIHPLVLEEKKKTIDRLEKEGRHEIFVSEAALTIESGFAEFFDKIIVVFCQEEIQIKRLMERDNIDREEALRKIASQMPTEEKLKSADYAINSSGAVQSTVEQTEKVFLSLKSDHKRKQGINRDKDKTT